MKNSQKLHSRTCPHCFSKDCEQYQSYLSGFDPRDSQEFKSCSSPTPCPKCGDRDCIDFTHEHDNRDMEAFIERIIAVAKKKGNSVVRTNERVRGSLGLKGIGLKGFKGLR